MNRRELWQIKDVVQKGNVITVKQKKEEEHVKERKSRDGCDNKG